VPSPKRQSQSPSSSLLPASVPACVGRLLHEAAATAPGTPVVRTVERLLDIVAELETGGGAGVRLRLGDEEIVVCRRERTPEARHSGVPPAEDAERLFPELAEERIVRLPNEGGTVHFAAPSFESASAESYDHLLRQLAAIVTLIVRGSDLEASGTREAPGSMAQLEKLATIGQTASQIVHEINNPLTAIIAYSEFLAKRLRDREMPEGDVDRLLRINEAATRIQRFCRELTDYSRPAGSLRELCDLGSVIDRALSFCVHGLRSADITVERIYRDVPPILGVETALTQVFVNLITNAWHAMADGGVLSIRTLSRDGWVEAEVADEGCGIDQADLPRIFDAYFTTKQKGSGVGLGLSIVRQIVEDHRGTVRVERGETRGTVFVLSFPPQHR
jgi:two-component system NtrC family sensor kinase